MAIEKKVYPVDVLAFHKNAHRHVDDAACLWIARTRPEAEHWFPGIKQAEIEFDGMGGENFQDGRSGDELLVEERILPFGVGGGIFDAHAGPNNSGKDGCELSLFCGWLGIQEDPALAKILRYVAQSDIGNSGHAMALGAIAKIMDYAASPEKVFAWQMLALEALYRKQRVFIEAENEYKAHAVIERLDKGRILAIIESASQHIKDAAFSNGASILIQRRPLTADLLPGNFAIFTSHRAKVDLSKVVSMLRQEEQRVRGRPTITDRRKLEAPGKIEGVPEWYFMNGATPACLNGALSAPDVVKSEIPFETIKEIVIAGVS